MENEDLRKEKQELEERFLKLKEFISPAFPERLEYLEFQMLPVIEQRNLETQLSAMGTYLGVLEWRIDRRIRMENKDWFDRLKKEKEELEKRLWKLDEFLNPSFPEHSEFQLLPKAEQEDLYNQWEVMERYLTILRRRIKREEEKRNGHVSTQESQTGTE